MHRKFKKKSMYIYLNMCILMAYVVLCVWEWVPFENREQSVEGEEEGQLDKYRVLAHVGDGNVLW